MTWGTPVHASMGDDLARAVDHCGHADLLRERIDGRTGQ